MMIQLDHKHGDDITSHLPASLRQMMEIEAEAKRRVDRILTDVAAGNTTIETEITKREGVN